MKNKKGLIAGIVILLVLVGIYVGLKITGSEDEKKNTEEEEITAFEVDSEDISQISIENNGNKYTFVYEDEGWKYLEDENIPLNEDFVSNIVSGITSIKAIRELENVENPADYGLESPQIKVTITEKDNTETTLNFGDDNQSVSGAYMSIGSNEKIYLVNSSVKTDLQFEKTELAVKEELPQISAGNIKKVEISNSEEVKTLEEEDAGGLWSFNKNNENQVSVDTSKVNDYMNHFSNLNWLDFVSYDTSNLSDYGLENPTKITISYEEEEKSEDVSQDTGETDTSEETEEPVMIEKQLVLLVGSTNEDGNYYVKTADGSYIYTMSASTVDEILNVSSENLISSLVADYALADMDKITMERNGETYVLTKEETEVKKEDSEETTTQTKYYLNEKEIEQSEVSKFYSKVSGLEWQSITEGKKGENPEMSITFEKEGGIKDTIIYYPFDENFYLVTRTDGTQMFVNKMKVREMIEAFDTMIENLKE